MAKKQAKQRSRGNGQGTISFDKTRGAFVAKVLVGYGIDGRPKYAKRRAKTKTEAEELLRDLHAEKKTGRLVASVKLTLGAYLDSWLASLPQHLAPNTRRSYAGVVRNQLKAQLGGRPLASLTAGEIEAMYRRLEATGLVRIPLYVHRVLSIALAEAFRLGHLAKNPMERVRAPELPRGKAEAYHTREETARLLAQLRKSEDSSTRALMLIGIETGARLSEVTGITWSDIDFEQGCLMVRSQLARMNGDWCLRPLKTGKATRVKFLSPEALEALRGERTRQLLLEFPNPLGLALLNGEGRPWDHTHANKRIKAMCTQAGVPVHASHTVFRHTYATHLLKSGVPLHDASREMGHSSVNLTANLYGHHAVESAKKAARTRQRYVEGASGSNDGSPNY